MKKRPLQTKSDASPAAGLKGTSTSYKAKDIKIREGLTFDDVLLVPQHSQVLPHEVSLESQFTRNIKLKSPILSAAMDTVTESKTAIVMAQVGGLGIIHKNMSPKAQAAAVRKVKSTTPNMAPKPIAIDTNKDSSISAPSSKDSSECLMVGAAIGAGGDYLERAKLLLDAGADVLIIDTAHGHSQGVLDAVTKVRQTFADYRFDLVGGNVATAAATEALIEAGVDCVKVGIGPGSICTTRIIAGIGVPQLTAVMDCAAAATPHGIPIIADGGIKFSGDMVKALAAGASTIMIGSLFAGTDESPGELITDQGKTYKSYRGMGSIGAMALGSKDRYFQSNVANEQKLVPEGIEGQVPYKGPLTEIVFQMEGGIRSAMGYTGSRSIGDLQKRAEFVKISSAGLKESHIHDVSITRESPNYKIT